LTRPLTLMPHTGSRPDRSNQMTAKGHQYAPWGAPSWPLRLADERGLQGTGGEGAGAQARALPDKAAPARMARVFGPETASALARPPFFGARVKTLRRRA
jgi:hypothetical protein